MHLFVKRLGLITLAAVLLVTAAWGEYDGSGTFNKITSLDDLESGTYYVFYGINASYNGAMTNTISSGRLGNTAVSLSGSSILNPSTAIVWYVVGDSVDGYTVYNEAADKYAEITTNSTSGYALNTSSTHEYVVSYPGTKGFQFQSNSATGGDRCISIYQTDWRPYIATGRYTLELYKLAPPAVDPIIYVVPTTLSGFSYEVGSGPSAEQSFTISGENLEGNISVTPPSNYEISTQTGASFSPTNPITLSPNVEGEVGETTIYVRQKAGLEVNLYNGETITAASSGADSKTVTCNGRVMPVYDYVEQFDNYPETSSSYNSGTFTGIDGSTWNYVKCAGAAAQAIDSPTPVLGRNQDPAAELYSGTLPGGVKQLEFEYMQAFTNNTNLEVYVNDTKVYTATSVSEQNTVKFSGIIDVNIDGNAVIKFLQPAGAGQVSIDNIRWSNSDAPSPITLASFDAAYVNGAVKLSWQTASETENLAFRVYRDGEMLAELDGAGTTSEPQSYSWTDNYVIPGHTYSYVLADVTVGNVEVKHTDKAVSVTAVEGDVAKDFAVGPAYPNPFNPVTVVPLNLAKEANVHARLYDMLGRPVQELHKGTLAIGSHTLKVDGSMLSTGIYFVHINVNNAVHVQKIALMK